MATEAKAIERQKKFKYRIEINGMPVALIQKLSVGKVTAGVTQHAGAGQNHPDKEAGMLTFENVVLTGVVPLEGPGNKFWQRWLDVIQDPDSGNGAVPKQYRQDFSIFDLAPTADPIRVWEYYDGWVCSYDPGERDSMSAEDDVLEEIEICYNYRKLVEQ